MLRRGKLFELISALTLRTITPAAEFALRSTRFAYSLALTPGIHPIVVHVAVEGFFPAGRAGQAELVVGPGVFAEVEVMK